MRKMSAQWMFRMLTEDNSRNRIEAGLEMLMQYNEEWESFLNRIATTNETWLHYWTPECKSTSMAWKTTDKTASQKFKEKTSVDKVLATIFWDHKGVLLLEYWPKGSTVTSASPKIFHF